MTGTNAHSAGKWRRGMPAVTGDAADGTGKVQCAGTSG